MWNYWTINYWMYVNRNTKRKGKILMKRKLMLKEQWTWCHAQKEGYAFLSPEGCTAMHH
jgi:hypothetical protein